MGNRPSEPPAPPAPGGDGLTSSLEWLPPDLSELTVFLLGSSWSLKSCVGNLLLKKISFNPDQESQDSLIHQVKRKKQCLTVINTPDFLSSTVGDLAIEIKFVDFPGPHMLLLVLQMEDFKEEHGNKLQTILQALGPWASDLSLVLLFTRGEPPSENVKPAPVEDLLSQTGGFHLWWKDLRRDDIIRELQKMIY